MVKWCLQNSITKNVEVVVVKNVDTVLSSLSMKKVIRSLITNSAVKQRVPWCVYTGAIFFVKSHGFTHENRYICIQKSINLWQKQNKKTQKEKVNFKKH